MRLACDRQGLACLRCSPEVTEQESKSRVSPLAPRTVGSFSWGRPNRTQTLSYFIVTVTELNEIRSLCDLGAECPKKTSHTETPGWCGDTLLLLCLSPRVSNAGRRGLGGRRKAASRATVTSRGPRTNPFRGLVRSAHAPMTSKTMSLRQIFNEVCAPPRRVRICAAHFASERRALERTRSALRA